jgi:rRNA maturation endonuclease Nob1
MNKFLENARKQFSLSQEKRQAEYNPRLNWDKICRHPEHDFPTHMCIPSGESYTHKCPICGVTTTISSPKIRF